MADVTTEAAEPDFIKITGAPVEGVAVPQVQQTGGFPVLEDVPNTPAADPVAADTQTAPAPAGPQSYVSERAFAPQNPYAVVGMLPGGTSTTVAKTDTGAAGKAAQAASGAAFDEQGKAIDARTGVDQQRAAATAEGAAQRVHVLDQIAAREAADAQTAAARNAQALAAFKQSQDDYDKAAGSLSSDRWWHNQSTGQKIGTLISIALSGMGQIFSAKAGVQARNGALDMINMAVDRDIDMQKAAVQAKERGVRVKESAYMAARQAGADEAQATALAKASALGRVTADIEQRLATTDDSAAKAQGQQLHAQLKQAQAQELQRVAELNATRIQSTSQSTPLLAGQVMAAQGAAQGLVPRDPKLATPYGQAPDPETRRIMVKEGGQLKAIDNALKVVSQGSANSVTSPGKKKVIDAAWAQLTGWVKGPDVMNAGASLTDSEKALLLDPLLSDSSMWTRDSTRNAAIGALRKLHEARVNTVRDYAVKTHL